MSLDVGKSRILTMTGLTKTRTKGELTPTAFRLVLSACKLNLPLVPSQDYVLQDNKRCEIYVCLFYILYRVYVVPIQDHYIITEGIATNLGWNVPNKFMTKCCSYYGVNESIHFNNVWEMSVQISLEANDLSTY
jgi:hypothetical protein